MAKVQGEAGTLWISRSGDEGEVGGLGGYCNRWVRGMAAVPD